MVGMGGSCYRVLQAVTGCYATLCHRLPQAAATGCYQAVTCCYPGCHRPLQAAAGCYRPPQAATGCHRLSHTAIRGEAGGGPKMHAQALGMNSSGIKYMGPFLVPPPQQQKRTPKRAPTPTPINVPKITLKRHPEITQILMASPILPPGDVHVGVHETRRRVRR